MKRISASSLFVILILAVNLRGSLGYVFRFGEPATSPTYQLIPFDLFMFWKVVIGGLMTVIVVWKMKMLSIHYAFIYLIVLLFSLICMSQTNSFHILGAARCMIIYGFLFVAMVSNESWVKISQINRAIEFMAAFGLVFLVYQIYQYYYSGILPAHSHANLFIRYGSFYDDSLVLGVLLPMFAGYFFSKYQNIAASLLIAALVCLVVILTGSMTAMGIVLLYVLWNFRKRHGLLIFVFCVGSGLAYYFRDQIKYVWLFKSGSIAGHLEGLRYFNEQGLFNVAGLSPFNIFVESGYLLFLYNFGVFVLIIVIAFHFKVLSACRAILLKSESSREMRLFTGATQGLTISVFLANLNYPVIIYPPVYLMVAVFSAIVIKRSTVMTHHKASEIKMTSQKNSLIIT